MQNDKTKRFLIRWIFFSLLSAVFIFGYLWIKNFHIDTEISVSALLRPFFLNPIKIILLPILAGLLMAYFWDKPETSYGTSYKISAIEYEINNIKKIRIIYFVISPILVLALTIGYYGVITLLTIDVWKIFKLSFDSIFYKRIDVAIWILGFVLALISIIKLWKDYIKQMIFLKDYIK